MLIQRDIGQYKQLVRQLGQSPLLVDMADQGNAEALFLLSQCFELSGDRARTEELLNQSARCAYEPAVLKLQRILSGSNREQNHCVIEFLRPHAKDGKWYVLDTLAEARARITLGDIRHQARRLEAEGGLPSRTFVKEEIAASNMDPDRQTAFHACKAAAETGEVTAMQRLSVMFKQGLGVQADRLASLQWLKRSAEAGEAVSQLEMGSAYSLGDGVDQDHQQSFRWTQKAAEQHGAFSLFDLAMKYIRGEGVNKDLQKGIELLHQAAWEGHTGACIKLSAVAAWQIAKMKPEVSGEMLLSELGDRVTDGLRDFIKDTLTRDASKGNAASQFQLAMYHQTQVDRGFYPQSGREEDIQWLERAAKQGLADAQYHLAEKLSSNDIDRLYRNGLSNTFWRAMRRILRTSRAFRLYLAAAKQGHVEAQYQIGAIQTDHHRLEGPTNTKAGLKWLERAADKGHLSAIMSLGAVYAEGRVLNENLEASADWYQKAAKLGNDIARFYMGWYSQKGIGVAKDIKAARAYFESSNSAHSELMLSQYHNIEAKSKSAADFENPGSDFFSLGCQFFLGFEIPVDIEEAAIWFGQGAAEGDAASQYNLALICVDESYSNFDVDRARRWIQRSAAQGYKPALDLLEETE